jgi:hypothetical protein
MAILGEGEDELPAKVVLVAAPRVPALPLRWVVCQDVDGVVLAVKSAQSNLQVAGSKSTGRSEASGIGCMTGAYVEGADLVSWSRVEQRVRSTCLVGTGSRRCDAWEDLVRKGIRIPKRRHEGL